MVNVYLLMHLLQLGLLIHVTSYYASETTYAYFITLFVLPLNIRLLAADLDKCVFSSMTFKRYKKNLAMVLLHVTFVGSVLATFHLAAVKLVPHG